MKSLYIIAIKIIKVLIKILPSTKMKIDIKKSKARIESKYHAKEIWSNNSNKKKNTDYKYELSIILPVYNVSKYLDKCLKSIINQKTKILYEIICINDGSTDNSLQILKKYSKQDNRIKIISQENQGLSVARNTGINESHGKYLMFVDSDDYISENCVERLMKEAKTEKCDLVKAGYTEFASETGKKIRQIKFKEQIITSANKESLEKIEGHAWGCVIKSAIFNNIKFPIGYWYEDMIMKTLVFPKCKKIKILNDSLYYYRINYNGLSRKAQKVQSYKCLEQYYLLEKCLERFPNLNITIDNYLYNNILNELSTMLWLRTRKLDSQTRKDIFALACDKIQHLNFKNNSQIEKIMKKRNYLKWQLYSIYKMLEEKSKSD